LSDSVREASEEVELTRQTLLNRLAAKELELEKAQVCSFISCQICSDDLLIVFSIKSNSCVILIFKMNPQQKQETVISWLWNWILSEQKKRIYARK
jgi:hypothetical protein